MFKEKFKCSIFRPNEYSASHVLEWFAYLFKLLMYLFFCDKCGSLACLFPRYSIVGCLLSQWCSTVLINVYRTNLVTISAVGNDWFNYYVIIIIISEVTSMFTVFLSCACYVCMVHYSNNKKIILIDIYIALRVWGHWRGKFLDLSQQHSCRNTTAIRSSPCCWISLEFVVRSIFLFKSAKY